MSERLIIEFYETSDKSAPLVSVLAYYGGEDPESAAWTIASFFEQIRSLKDSRFDDAGVLAARFVYWLGYECRKSEDLCDFDGVEIIRNSNGYRDYLTMRISVDRSGPHVRFVNDGRNLAEEFVAAEEIANQAASASARLARQA